MAHAQDGFFGSLKTSFATLTNKVFGRNATDKIPSIGRNDATQDSDRKIESQLFSKGDVKCMATKTRDTSCISEGGTGPGKPAKSKRQACLNNKQKQRNNTNISNKMPERNGSGKFVKMDQTKNTHEKLEKQGSDVHGMDDSKTLSESNNKDTETQKKEAVQNLRKTLPAKSTEETLSRDCTPRGKPKMCGPSHSTKTEPKSPNRKGNQGLSNVDNKSTAVKTKHTCIPEGGAVTGKPAKGKKQANSKAKQNDSFKNNSDNSERILERNAPEKPVNVDKTSKTHAKLDKGNVHNTLSECSNKDTETQNVEAVRTSIGQTKSPDCMKQDKVNLCEPSISITTERKSPSKGQVKFSKKVNVILSNSSSPQPKPPSQTKKRGSKEPLNDNFKFESLNKGEASHSFAFTANCQPEPDVSSQASDNPGSSSGGKKHCSNKANKAKNYNFPKPDPQKINVRKPALKPHRPSSGKQDDGLTKRAHKEEKADIKDVQAANPAITTEIAELERKHAALKASLTREFLTYPNIDSCQYVDKLVFTFMSKEQLFLYLEIGLHQSHIPGILSRKTETAKAKIPSENEFYKGSVFVPESATQYDIKLFHLGKRCMSHAVDEAQCKPLNSVYFQLHPEDASQIHSDIFAIKCILRIKYGLDIPALKNLGYSPKSNHQIPCLLSSASDEYRYILPCLLNVFEKYTDVAQTVMMPLRIYDYTTPVMAFELATNRSKGRPLCVTRKCQAVYSQAAEHLLTEILMHTCKPRENKTDATRTASASKSDAETVEVSASSKSDTEHISQGKHHEESEDTAQCLYPLTDKRLPKRRKKKAKKINGRNNMWVSNDNLNTTECTKIETITSKANEFCGKHDFEQDTGDCVSQVDEIFSNEKLEQSDSTTKVSSSGDSEDWMTGPAIDFSLNWLSLCKGRRPHHTLSSSSKVIGRAPQPVSLMSLYTTKTNTNNNTEEHNPEDGNRKGKRVGKDGKKLQKAKVPEESETENRKVNKNYKCNRKK